MRLIDADKLKEYHCRKMCDDVPCPIPCDVVRWIDEQPTAYDIDNVVEQLEEMTDKPMELKYDVPLIKHIIEIVKGGAK